MAVDRAKEMEAMVKNQGLQHSLCLAQQASQQRRSKVGDETRWEDMAYCI